MRELATSYKLIRKLRECPLPVGSVAISRFNGDTTVCRFTYKMPTKSCISDLRLWNIPAWICDSMPHYFRRMKAKKEIQ